MRFIRVINVIRVIRTITGSKTRLANAIETRL